MKKLTTLFSPYFLLLIPVFVGILVLLFIPDYELLKQNVAQNGSFFKLPNVNIYEVLVNVFKFPFL